MGGTEDWIASGIVHAVDQGTNVINLSLGSSLDSELIHEAVKYAYNAGVLVVAAAGNSNALGEAVLHKTCSFMVLRIFSQSKQGRSSADMN